MGLLEDFLYSFWGGLDVYTGTLNLFRMYFGEEPLESVSEMERRRSMRTCKAIAFGERSLYYESASDCLFILGDILGKLLGICGPGLLPIFYYKFLNKKSTLS